MLHSKIQINSGMKIPTRETDSPKITQAKNWQGRSIEGKQENAKKNRLALIIAEGAKLAHSFKSKAGQVLKKTSSKQASTQRARKDRPLPMPPKGQLKPITGKKEIDSFIYSSAELRPLIHNLLSGIKSLKADIANNPSRYQSTNTTIDKAYKRKDTFKEFNTTLELLSQKAQEIEKTAKEVTLSSTEEQVQKVKKKIIQLNLEYSKLAETVKKQSQTLQIDAVVNVVLKTKKQPKNLNSLDKLVNSPSLLILTQFKGSQTSKKP